MTEAVCCGEEVKLTLQAEDDNGIRDVVAKLTTPAGTERLTLTCNGNTWECAYIPQAVGSYSLTAVVTDSKGQETVKELGAVTVNEDTPPRIVSFAIPPSVNIYADFEMTVEATDDRKIDKVKVTFVKQGKTVGETTLSQNDAGVFSAKYAFRAYGTIRYTITVTDIKGQSDTEVDEIEVLLG